jgi:MFS family permease
MSAQDGSVRRVVNVYVISAALGTLAASLIWGVTTLYQMASGLNIFQVMLVNTAWTFGMIVFEVPTGVIADTIGRKASYLLSIFILLVSTLVYVAAGMYHWGMAGFMLGSVMLALGWTFQTGAVDAWLVDALDHVGWEGPKDTVFAKGGIATSASMLVGTMLGGFLGQVNLAWPFIARSAILAVCFAFIAIWMKDWGFHPRPLKASTFGAEARRIMRGGVTYGWRHPVVRVLLFQSLLASVFFAYGFYSLQPYLLQLLGQNLVWVAATVTALGSAGSILGNMLVGPIMAGGRRRPGRVLAAMGVLFATAIFLSAVVGFVWAGRPGPVPLVLVSALWILGSITWGVEGPVRQSFINAHIPSPQRATVLSFDALFGDAGGSVGQPALGYVSQVYSIPVAWVAGAAVLFGSVPLYLRADRAALAEASDAHTPLPVEPGEAQPPGPR